MPEMSYQPTAFNDRTSLTDGWHPAFLLAQTDEATPENWQMFQQSPRMYRWFFAVWPTPDAIATQRPERQTTPSSQKFSPGGKYQASKAYVWTCELLGHKVQPGERVNLDPLMPIPCRVKIERKDEYANIKDLEKWPEGAQYLTPELKAALLAFLHEAPPETPPAAPPQPPTPPPPAPPVTPAPQPGMQSWGNQPQPGQAPRW